MANANDLASYTQPVIDSYKLATATANIAATGNAVANLAIMGGGVTQPGGAYIVRKVTIVNIGNGNCQGGQVAVLTSNDGNISNAVTANTVLSNITANLTYQDCAVATTANNTIQSASVLYLDVITANSNGQQVIFNVFGNLVNP